MAIDPKYGHVDIPNSDIAADEPVVVFRAKDRLLPPVLRYYLDQCEKAGSPQHHLDALEQTIVTVDRWQASHPTQIPRSAG